MSKDNSDYKKSLLPFKKGGNSNSGRPGSPLEEKNQGTSKSEDQKNAKKSKK